MGRTFLSLMGLTKEECLDILIQKRNEIEDLNRLNQQLKDQIEMLLRINAVLARPGGANVRPGRARRGNRDTISEASFQ